MLTGDEGEPRGGVVRLFVTLLDSDAFDVTINGTADNARLCRGTGRRSSYRSMSARTVDARSGGLVPLCLEYQPTPSDPPAYRKPHSLLR